MNCFETPGGLRQPLGLAPLTAARSPWPLSPPLASTRRPAGADRRAVARELRRLTLGPGGTPVRICVVEDLSGSMGSIASAREAVVRGLLAWCETRLAPEDELALISFGGDAYVRLQPTPVGEAQRLVDARLASYATMLGPTWGLVGAFPATELRTVCVVISDGLVADLGRGGSRAAATGAGVDDVVLVLPGAGAYEGEAPRCWTQAFPGDDVRHVDATDAAQLTRTMAQIVADATNRELLGGRPLRDRSDA